MSMPLSARKKDRVRLFVLSTLLTIAGVAVGLQEGYTYSSDQGGSDDGGRVHGAVAAVVIAILLKLITYGVLL